MTDYDKKTEEIASDLIAMFDAAIEKEDLAEMERIAGIAAATPNQPLQRAILRRLEEA